MNAVNLKLIKRTDMRPVASPGRKLNKTYRTREHLTEAEMAKLLTVLKSNRHGHRDWLIALLIYRHGLRVSEACDLRWDDIDLAKRTVQVRRLKGSTDSVHYLERDELAGLKRLQREQEPKAANPTGKRIIKYRTFKRTKKEAKAELVRLINSAHQGDYVDPSKTTVSEFAGRWLRNWAAINVGAKTLERYEELISAHVRPYIGAVPIQKLQPVHLAELYAKLLREGNRQRGLSKVTGLSPRTVGHVHRALHKALKVAVEWGVVQRNAAAVARPPKVEARNWKSSQKNKRRRCCRSSRANRSTR